MKGEKKEQIYRLQWLKNSKFKRGDNDLINENNTEPKLTK